MLFLIAGFVTRAEIGSLRGLARRFAAAAIGLLLVAGLLTNYLFVLVRNVRTERTIQAVLDDALSHQANTALVNLEFDRGGNGVDILSTIRAPRVMAPETVRAIQDALAARLGEPVRLYMRCSVTQDVSATGSTNLRPYLSLDGHVTSAPVAPDMLLRQQAEQVAREVAATRPDLTFNDLELLHVADRPVILISIASTREPTADDVARFETLLRQRLGQADLRIVVRRTTSTDVTSKGRILLGDAHFGAVADDPRRAEVERSVRANLEALPNTFAPAVDAARREGRWVVRAEVVGARVPPPADVRAVETRSAAALGEPVQLTVWARTELQVTDERYAPVGDARSAAAAADAAPPKEP
ncbi:MAG: hypothetical protein U0802_16635 [Candidatus Binatia bacterium]